MANPPDPSLIAALQTQKQQGATPQQAVLNLELACAGHAAGVINPRTIGAEVLTLALREVYGEELTALAAAIILHNLGYPVDDIAVALKVNYSGLSALDLGGILLNPNVYPQTGRPELSHALTGAGFSPDETLLAANILYPVQVTVLATQPWQSTGVQVTGTQTTSINYVSGNWYASPGTGNCTGTGDPRLIAKPGYTLPGAPEGALVGRIGGRVFLVGNAASAPQGAAGLLELCINDDLDGRYGMGLKDNRGSLLIKISTSA
ncbi:hypothetical protein [Microvirgula aerodenitrificans]|uniref:hypothetical protein n=1 Tax=Microvirgula aerodenitrificans TaxID=57480 RepID=UPI002F3F477E